MKKHKTNGLAFFLLLCFFTIVMAIVWEFTIHERVYSCTDSIPFGYLSPGTWVHGEVVYLDSIPQGRSMSEPDAIQLGWSISRLWFVWLSMVILSTVLSWIFSRKELKE